MLAYRVTNYQYARSLGCPTARASPAGEPSAARRSLSGGRVAGRRCHRPAPSEPYVRLSSHTAQVSPNALSTGRGFDTFQLHCLHDTRLQTTHVPVGLSPVNGVPVYRCMQARASSPCGCSLFYEFLFLRPHQVSRDERPGGSLPAFAWGDVARMGGATPIRSLTERPSLSPPSFTRCPVSVPYGSLSQWESNGLTTFRSCTCVG